MLSRIMELPSHITQTRHTIVVVPRYAETDQAGVIHHTVYPVWFEMGRTELLRVNGLAYRTLEKAGYFFVVAALHAKFRRPAYYDEPLNLETIQGRVTASRVEHTYRLTDQATGVLVAEGGSTLACVDAEGKLRRVPSFMLPELDEKPR